MFPSRGSLVFGTVSLFGSFFHFFSPSNPHYSGDIIVGAGLGVGQTEAHVLCHFLAVIPV